MQRPNILFIMPDQLRADFLSCYGAEFLATPHIDSLASSGLRFERAYSPSPICVPARAMLMTGRNAIQNGVLTNEHYLRPDLAECGIHTWPELISDAGYATSAIGKMHFYPWDIDLGFQTRVICEDKRWLLIEDDYHEHLKEHGLRKLHGNEHEGYFENKGAFVHNNPREHSWDHYVGTAACHHIRNQPKDRPFAMMVGFPGPHCPYDPNEEDLAGLDEKDMPEPIPAVPDNAPGLRETNIVGNRMPWNGVDYEEFTPAQKRKIRLHYAALVKQIDDEVGDIISALRETGQLDNTLIIFSSDHGDHLGDHDLIGKATYYESSIHVPLIVSGPGVPQGECSSDLVSIGDITATMLKTGGCELPDYLDARPLPGIDNSESPSREQIFGYLAKGCMVFDGTWKLCRYTTGESLLFNLQEDPREQLNRIDDPTCQDVLRRLDADLTSDMLRSIADSNQEKLVAHSALYDETEFGRKGWKRRYPQDYGG
ncbi:MAG: sulfatase-like hydrolase/transferase [Candidatus Latescibacteria bacterium]|nr:sulfatase-like hydrolase/transferase [Candidatus Latescibacterota bacterium]